MSINSDIQQLEPGPLLTFYELDATAIGAGIVRFHGIEGMGATTWQSVVYSPWSINAEGFARTSEQQPRPKLQVGNVNSSISLLCMLYDDLVGARLARKRTFAKYLDAVNFPGGINLTADPSQEFPDEVWFIDRKSAETANMVEFELASPLDFQGVQLPRRQIIANQCNFEYRGPYCNYTGDPVATILDEPTSDPLLDNCSRSPAGCALREWPDEQQNYGGFAAAGLMRT